MFRGCSATGRLSHTFDKVTHRCKCGRWQSGFKPKCEPVRPRNECQICERTQALDSSGRLGHHGYKRPGWGFITGDCMGAGHLPYPATDALERYLVAVRDYIAKCQARLAELPTLTEIEYQYRGAKKEQLTATIKQGDVYHYDFERRTSFPGFDDIIRIQIGKVTSEISFATKDEARVIKRIADAK